MWPGMNRRSARPPRDPQVGAVAPMVVICLLFLIGFLAMSMNMGILMDARTQLQAGADGAALAAAGSLDGTVTGLNRARQAAVDYSYQHDAYGELLRIDSDADVTFGRWHFKEGDCITAPSSKCLGWEPYTRTFSVNNPGRVTAVHVSNGRDGGTHNPEIDLPFGHFVGRLKSSVKSEAIAVGPGVSATKCGLPFGVAVCKIREAPPSTAVICPQSLYFSNTHDDSVGFVSFDGDAASGHDAIETINTGICTDESHSVGEVRVQNGADFNKQVIEALQGKTTGVCLIGSEQTMPVIEAGCDTDWDNPTFNQTSQVVGFMRVKLKAVTDNQGNVEGCPGEEPPQVDRLCKLGQTPCTRNSDCRSVSGDVCEPGARALVLDIICEPEPPSEDDLGGGEVFNSAGARLLLVQ